MALRDAVEAALTVSGMADTDRAAADLALTYAAALDDTGPECPECGRTGADLVKVGPLLLAVLESLLLSPRARAAAKKAVITSEPAANPLDQLAAARSRRGRPSDLDAAATGSDRP